MDILVRKKTLYFLTFFLRVQLLVWNIFTIKSRAISFLYQDGRHQPISPYNIDIFVNLQQTF